MGKLRTVADWHDLLISVRRVADEKAGAIVVCADFRNVQVMNKELASAALAGLLEFNPRVYRSALLLTGDAHMLRLQLERLLRETRNLRRRICVDTAEAKAWLSSCLGSSEQACLDEFLAPQAT